MISKYGKTCFSCRKVEQAKISPHGRDTFHNQVFGILVRNGGAVSAPLGGYSRLGYLEGKNIFQTCGRNSRPGAKRERSEPSTTLSQSKSPSHSAKVDTQTKFRMVIETNPNIKSTFLLILSSFPV
jgi:hypothetical protein